MAWAWWLGVALILGVVEIITVDLVLRSEERRVGEQCI